MSPILTRVSSGQGFSSVATYKRSFIARSAGGAYQIARSLRFNSPDSTYLSRTPASAGNRKTWTWAGWVKRCKLGTFQTIISAGNSSPAQRGGIRFWNTDVLDIAEDSGGYLLQTTQVFRDVSAWFHLVVAFDSTQATSTNRIKVYVNGSQVTTFSTATYPSQNHDSIINTTDPHRIGELSFAGNIYELDAYLADCFLIDGQALDPTSFGEFSATTGVWMPKAYTGTYGTNGFHLDFSNNASAAALGTDSSGRGNTWSVNNLSVTAGAGNDSLVDVPTNGTEVDTGSGGQVRGNYCTINSAANAGLVLSNGNLDFTGTGNTARSAIATVGMPSGKWYFEGTIVVASSGGNLGFGVQNQLFNAPSGTQPHNNAYGWVAITSGSSSTLYKANNGTFTSIGTYAAGDVIGIAVDVDAGKLWISKNGTWVDSGNPAAGTNVAYTGLSGTLVPYAYGYNTSDSGVFNFGQRPFAYTAPSGFKALCTANLPAPLVTKPSTVMDVKLYTGNGSTQTISGLNTSPDLVWIKSRSGATSHGLFDVVRGANKTLYSNLTAAEDTYTNTLTSFNSDGFSLGADSWGGVNSSGSTYAAWCFDAGSSTVTNTQGSISSQVRANASAGFSVVTWTASGTSSTQTVGHGLGIAPAMVICKSRTDGTTYNDWMVYHSSLSASNNVRLNSTGAQQTFPTYGALGSPTSSAITLTAGGSGNFNVNSGNMVAYCFAPVAGYSSFGSYTGGTQGTFVYLGFTPKWLLVKSATGSVGDNWKIYDSSRSPYNVRSDFLAPNTSGAEVTANLNQFDFVSNGFVVRTNPAYDTNFASTTYIYAAFAENPFQYARAR